MTFEMPALTFHAIDMVAGIGIKCISALYLDGKSYVLLP